MFVPVYWIVSKANGKIYDLNNWTFVTFFMSRSFLTISCIFKIVKHHSLFTNSIFYVYRILLLAMTLMYLQSMWGVVYYNLVCGYQRRTSVTVVRRRVVWHQVMGCMPHLSCRVDGAAHHLVRLGRSPVACDRYAACLGCVYQIKLCHLLYIYLSSLGH